MDDRESVSVEDLTAGDKVYARSVGLGTSEYVVLSIDRVRGLDNVVVLGVVQGQGLPGSVRSYEMVVPRGTQVERVGRHITKRYNW